jgi:predicted phage terminase large subunit-like protein
LPTRAQGDPLKRQPGEPLWPGKFSLDINNRQRANVGELDFASLYQQQPRPASGGFFDESQITIVDYVPQGLQWFCYIDLALGEKTTSDFNAALPCALDPATGDIIYRDMLLVQDLTEFLVQLAEMMKSPAELGTRWGVEMVAFQALVMKELLRNKKLANVAISGITPNGDKVQRARPMQTRARQGHLKLKRAPWNRGFINEMLTFPKGKHDDQVDTASGGLQMISDGEPVQIFV